MTAPPIIPGILFVGPTGLGPSGPLAAAHTVIGPLPTSGGPTLATMVCTIPTFMHGGIGPYTTISSIHTFLVTTPTFRSKPYQPPFAYKNYMPGEHHCWTS